MNKPSSQSCGLLKHLSDSYGNPQLCCTKVSCPSLAIISFQAACTLCSFWSTCLCL